MPYITEELRKRLDPGLNPLINQLQLIGSEGAVNYAITKILSTLYWQNYSAMNTALGVLGAVGQEFYRRVVTPYEDKKMESVGDVY